MVELLAFAVLGFLLAKTHGHFHPVGIGILGILFFVFSVRIFFPTFLSYQTKSHSIIFSALVGWFFLFSLWLNSGIIYPTAGASLLVMDVVMGLALMTWLFFNVNLLTEEKYFSAHISSLFFVLTVALLFFAKILVLHVSPAPHIDVFFVNNIAADFALQGKNPYTQIYPDIYNGAYAYLPSFVYGPPYLWWSIPFIWIFGDVRYGHVAAEFMTLIGLILFFKMRTNEKNLIYSIGILWIAFPVSLFVLEQSWIDPVIIMFYVWLLYFLANEKYGICAVIAALLAATKPYSLLVPFLAFIYLFKIQGGVNALKWSAICGIVFLLILAPFLLDDASGFYKTTIQWMLNAPLRTDSLSLPSLWANVTRQAVPGWLLTLIYLFALGATALWLFKNPSRDIRMWIYSLIILYGAIFLFGKQAFCNYYYLWAFFILTGIF